MNKTEESDKRWEGGGKICLKAYQKSGVTIILPVGGINLVHT